MTVSPGRAARARTKRSSHVLLALSTLVGTVVAATPTVEAGGNTDCTSFPLSGAPFPEHLVIGETVDGNLSIPAGVVCVVIDSTVNGNIFAADGALASLVIEGSLVTGNVELGSGVAGFLNEASASGNYTCHQCLFADIRGSEVGGNVQAKGAEQGVITRATTIGGNLDVTDSAFFFAIDGQTHVAGNVSARRNVGPWSIQDATIGGNLQVSRNTLTEEAFPDCNEFPCVTELANNFVSGNVTFTRNQGEPAEISDNTIDGVLSCRRNQPAPTGAGNETDQSKGQCQLL